MGFAPKAILSFKHRRYAFHIYLYYESCLTILIEKAAYKANEYMKEEECEKEQERKKSIARYSVCLEKQIECGLTLDRNIFILSYLAIGLLISFHDKLNNIYLVIFWFLSLSCFAWAIQIIMFPLRFANSDYLSDTRNSKSITSGEGREKLEAKIKKNELKLYIAFTIGSIGSLLVFIFISMTLFFSNNAEIFNFICHE